MARPLIHDPAGNITLVPNPGGGTGGGIGVSGVTPQRPTSQPAYFLTYDAGNRLHRVAVGATARGGGLRRGLRGCGRFGCGRRAGGDVWR